MFVFVSAAQLLRAVALCQYVLMLGSVPLAAARKLRDGGRYEYVVVGAGAAGSAAAARLALAGRRVLLLEAGGEPGLLAEVPGAAMALHGSDIDWLYATLPNGKSCLASAGRACRFRRGRCLGGSTALNYMLYVRGAARDYDYGLPGWARADLEPYFLRAEGLQCPARLPPSSRLYHNTTGPVEIGFFEDPGNPWHERIVDGLLALNFPYNPDVNAASQVGVSRALGFVHGGARVTAAAAYLNMENVRRNLHVAPNTVCTGVIIDGGHVARGVTAVRGRRNDTMSFYATEEVILSAGAVGSAQLLMLSGVGPAEHLREVGIPVRVNSPVGENMLDHVSPVMVIKVGRASKPTPNLGLLKKLTLNSVEWLLTRGGPLASIGVTDVVSFANTRCYDFVARKLKKIGPECDVPNVETLFSFVDRYAINMIESRFRRMVSKEVADQVLAANGVSDLLVVSPICLQPKSRGWIRLRSADPLAPPLIAPNYLDDERDVDEIVESIKLIEHLVETPALRQRGASLLRLRLRACRGLRRDAYWACYARHMTYSGFHAVGTAALGAVVDAGLRVAGVRALRVADLSVLPALPRAHTAAAALALGERLAALVLGERRVPSNH